MDKLELLNKIKWQIYMRLPNGGIFEKCVSRIKNKEENDPINYIFSGSYLEISILEMYIKGYYSVKEDDLLKFYEFLKKSPQVNIIEIKNNLFFEFSINNNKVKIPIPNLKKSELLAYRFELLDLILPYLMTGYESFKELSFNEGPYEYKENDFDFSLKKDDVVFDLGANFGMFSALAASKGCEVYTFEPLTYIVDEYLSKLVEIYQNLHLIKKGVSNKSGESFFDVDMINFGGSNLTINPTENKVQIITIDDFVSEKDLPNVDFIKADIEGAEVEMLEGARYTLKEYAPKLAICTYHNLGDEKKIRKLIKSANPKYEIKRKWKKIYAVVDKWK